MVALVLQTGLPFEYWAAPSRREVLDTALVLLREQDAAAADPRGPR
jgi:hypothetical protein